MSDCALRNCQAIRVTPPGGHFFFGYYDKSPWHASHRWMLALRAGFMDRPPGPEDRADVGLIDLEKPGVFEPFASTCAWNWQQGCMLQWLDENRVIFNDCRAGRFVAVILNVWDRTRQELPVPVYAVSPDRRSGYRVNFSRLHTLRPGYGYAGPVDPFANEPAPERDGVFRVDLQTGREELVLSVARLAREADPEGKYRHWVNHVQVNTDGSRFAVLHRRNQTHGRLPWTTRLMTASPDGSDARCLADYGSVSHYDWQDTRRLLAWAKWRQPDEGYFLFDENVPEPEQVGGGVLTCDGHCSFSPNRRWVLTDTYPDAEGKRTLILYDLAGRKRMDLGRFLSPTPRQVEIRCDLHPRWRQDGRQICLDSVHEGYRGMYVLDVTDLQA